jgi:hypothetical protein
MIILKRKWLEVVSEKKTKIDCIKIRKINQDIDDGSTIQNGRRKTTSASKRRGELYAIDLFGA